MGQSSHSIFESNNSYTPPPQYYVENNGNGSSNGYEKNENHVLKIMGMDINTWKIVLNFCINIV